MKKFNNKKLTPDETRAIHGKRSGYCMGNSNIHYDKKKFGGGYIPTTTCGFYKEVCDSPANRPSGMKLVAIRWHESLWTLDLITLVDCYYSNDEFPCTGSLIWC